MVMRLGSKRYLGDGVYVEFTGYGEVKLWTEREDGTHWMVLGPGELTALLRFVEEIQRAESDHA
jgi:hypothetical protein